MRGFELTTAHLRTRLVLLATLTVLPALAVITGTQWFARQRALETTIDESRRMAHTAAAQQASVFTGTARLLQTLADANVGGNPRSCTATLSTVQQHHSAQTAVFVLNAAGVIVCPQSPTPHSYADREWFQRAMALRRTVLSDFQISRFFGKPDVVMALPDVGPSGSIRYVYAAAIDLQELARTAGSTRLPPMSTMTLIDRHRTILVRFPQGEEWVGKTAPNSGAVDRLANGAAEDVREDVGIDGIQRLWITVPVDIGAGAGLVLGIGTPHTVAFAAAGDLLRRSALLLAIVVAATMTIGWLAAGAFVLRPMGALSTVVRRLADGDLTARAELATAVPGLREVTESVNLMAETLEVRQHAQKLEAIGKLAGGIAHDFNNMLTAIIGNAEVLRDDLETSDAHRRVVDQILRAGRRSAELTHQLLAFSRKQMLAPRILQVSDVVSSVTPMLRRLLGERIELRAIVTAQRSVKADAGQLEQVLVNLAVNARDAMPGGGVLTIETSDVVVSTGELEQEMVAAGSYAVISVRDTGGGMDASTQSRVFEPFFTTKPLGRGTGLGLATVYGIVKQSGGHVFLSSEVGRGSCFKVYLPHTTESEPEADAPPPPAPARAAGGGETVLLVEDEPAVREFVVDVLERAGYSVHEAQTGTDAVALAGTFGGVIDLLLTDVVLPDFSGRVVAEHIRTLHPEAAILYMSGYTDDVIGHDGVLDEGTDFLAKPFTIDALLARVRQSMAGRAPHRGR